MRVRDSGMPEREALVRLFDVELILDRLGVDERLRDVVEPGCGHDTVSVSVAGRSSGVVHTCDVEDEMVVATPRARDHLVGHEDHDG